MIIKQLTEYFVNYFLLPKTTKLKTELALQEASFSILFILTERLFA